MKVGGLRRGAERTAPCLALQSTLDPELEPPGGQQIPFLQRTCPARIKSPGFGCGLGLSWLPFPRSGFSEPPVLLPLKSGLVTAAACCGEQQDYTKGELSMGCLASPCQEAS